MKNVKIKTEDFKTVLSKVQKGMGHGKILPITDYILMECTDGNLRVTSTDLINWVTYQMPLQSDDFQVIVQGDQLAKLINKTSVPEVELSLDKNGNLTVKGNGKYTLDVLEEEFPEFDMDIPDDKEAYSVSVADLQSAFKVGASSVAVDMIMPCLMGYKMGGMVCSTNSIKMCVNKVKIFGEDILIAQDLANLLTLLDDEKAIVDIADGKLLFTTKNLTVFGPALEGLEEYPDLSEILKTTFPFSVRLNTQNFQGALERLDIFKDKLKVNGVKLTFTKNYITLSDIDGKNDENLNYTKKLKLGESKSVELNLNYLLDILRVIDNETVDLFYGDDNCIKVEAEKLTHFLCVLEEE